MAENENVNAGGEEEVFIQEVSAEEIASRKLVETKVSVKLLDKRTGKEDRLVTVLQLPLGQESLAEMVKVHGEDAVFRVAMSGAKNAAQNFFRTPLRKRDVDALSEMAKVWTLSYENPGSMPTADDIMGAVSNPLVTNESLFAKMEEALGVPMTPQQKQALIAKRTALLKK